MLRANFASALGGLRRIVFVAGEAGIGKTTAVELFLEESAAAHPLVFGRGQCVEHSGSGMAFLPVLEALERICRSDARARVLGVLREHAPTWLAQLPASLAADDRDELERRVQGATQERRFRELAQALELLTADDPLALWFEDLHWCDPETVALISFLARRTEEARLLIIGTYRPVEAIVHQHRIKALAQELHAQGTAATLLLPFLSSAAIEGYLRQRFDGGNGLPIGELTEALQSRTEGNPLFLVRVVDYAVAQGILAFHGDQWQLTSTAADLAALFPSSLRELIGQQLAQVTDEERQVLEAASVVGEEFALADVAAALELAPEVVERGCENLARQRHLLVLGEPEKWPDGTLTLRTRFVHALYRQAIQDQILPTRPPTWHARIGARRAAAFGADTAPIAAELADHFQRAGDLVRAIEFHAEAGRYAMRHQAHRVAATQYTAALELLGRLPGTPERARHEAELQVALGVAYMVVSGYSAPEVERAYARAGELCEGLGEAGPLFPTLYGLWRFHLTRGELRTSRPIAERMLLLARQMDDAGIRLQAHQALALNDFFQGEFAPADEHLQQSLALYDPREHRAHLFQYGHDPAVLSLCFRGWTLWLLGFPDQALRVSVEAVSLARKIGYAPSLVQALHGESLVRRWRGEWSEAGPRSQEAVNLAVQHELPYLLSIATNGLGVATAELGQAEDGLAYLRRGLDMYLRTGARVGLIQILIATAEALAKLGRYDEASRALSEAQERDQASGAGSFAAEAARLRGVLLLCQAEPRPPSRRRRKPSGGDAAPEAEACFLQALAIARKQGARGWELRAATNLAVLWGRLGRSREAHELLAGILGWFTEGADTMDLRNARTSLAQLG